MEDALGIDLIGSLTDNSGLTATAKRYLDSVEGGGLYRNDPAAAVADLRSTAIAYAIRGQSSIDIARRFTTTTGFAMLPDLGPTAEAGTLESTFLGFGLATGFDNLAALP